MHRSIRTLTLTVTAALAATGATLVTAPASAGGSTVVRTSGELVRYNTHLPMALPGGASARVQSVSTPSDKIVVTLTLKGAKPNTEYGAHAHVNACDASNPGGAGGHFQYEPGGATDPAFANPRNEIWLDLTTDGSGTGTATTVVNWKFPGERRAKSVIIHVEHTHTGPTDSGVAGARLGCLTVPF